MAHPTQPVPELSALIAANPVGTQQISPSLTMPTQGLDQVVYGGGSQGTPVTQSQMATAKQNMAAGSNIALGTLLGMTGDGGGRPTEDPEMFRNVMKAFDKRTADTHENFFSSPEYAGYKAQFQKELDHLIPIEQAQHVVDAFTHELKDPDVTPKRFEKLQRMITNSQAKLEMAKITAAHNGINPDWAERTFRPPTLKDLGLSGDK